MSDSLDVFDTTLPFDPIRVGSVGAAARRLEESKRDLLTRALDTGKGAQHGPGLEHLVRRYYRHTAPEDLLGRDPVDVLGAVVSHRRAAQNRPQGTAVVHAFTPSVEGHGWSAGHTVIEIVTDDMPFLVDSVTASLGVQGRAIHLVIHPQFVVRRDVAGALQEVLQVDDEAELPEGAIVESWMHVEIDRETDSAALTDIQVQLQRVLRDVREAVEDWPRMLSKAVASADELEAAPPVSVPVDEVAESVDLLRWLVGEHFTFLGYREYSLSEDGTTLDPVPGTGLGIMRSDRPSKRAGMTLSPEVRSLAREPRVLVLTKANSRSTVHRATYLDYVGVKTFDADGNVVGERRFLGLFTSTAYTQSVLTIPVLRRTVDQVLEQSGFRVDGHSYKDLLQVLETYPRDELFQVESAELTETALAVLHMQERRQTRLFMRRDRYGRFASCLVYLPRDRYTTTVRLRMADVLREEFDTDLIDYTARVSESMLARLHFVVRRRPDQLLPVVSHDPLEARLTDATRSWDDEFSDALIDQCGEELSARLGKKYADAFPEAYKEDFAARTGVIDVRQLESLAEDGGVALNLYEPHAAASGERRFKIYRRGGAISLSTVLPVLQRMGIEVVDERPYEIEALGSTMWVYDFGLRLDSGLAFELGSLKQRFQDAFLAAWSGAAEADGFNALVVAAGLTWREAMVLRAYARYLRQTGTAFSQTYLESCLVANVPIARLLVQLFEARFDPAFAGDRENQTEFLRSEIESALESVASLDNDRILRSFLALIGATLRTNYFQTGSDGQPKAYVSFKLDPALVPDLPAPKPKFEIWVYSPRVEGVHLRFGAVARGGLRWSDRREDFRTEVLGLVKAQMVKNAVIVPVGAKGGFVVKLSPDPSVDREAWLAEGVACYRMFISALLDVTDNLVGGAVVPPPNVVRHDADDTYLVVAADKGTATFSDIANDVALSYGFWLGDAFASGGSVGYDHKAMGITARGAWESVKRHFREMGHDTQEQDFTVVGVGDMSGDVFGNGMLLSEHIRLVAAFDHRHVFLDPNPDAASSYAERRRLFDLPRSSWADYDQELISEGGGIFSRAAKSIALSPQVRNVLGIADDVERMTPAELMRAILTAPVDLLWNGGIGTYVKATTETQHRRRRQGQRRHPRRRLGAALPRGGRGRQPRPHPARPHRGLALRRTHQHRRHRQLGRRRHLRPRGQHQDPARPGGARRRPHAQAAQRPARADDRRGRPARAARQLRAEHPARQRARAGALDAHGAPALHPVDGGARRARPGPGVPAHRRADRRPQRDRRGALVARVRRAGGVLEDHPHRRPARVGAGRRALVRPRAAGLLPDAGGGALRPAAREPPAAPPDHHDPRGQRHDQPRRHHLRVPRGGGDRRRPGRDRACLHRGPRGLRPAGLLAPGRGARQRRTDGSAVRAVPRVAPPARPRDPLGAHRPRRHGRRRGRDRALPQRDRPHHPAGARRCCSASSASGCSTAPTSSRRSAPRATSRSRAARCSTSSACSTWSRWRRPPAATPRTPRGSTSRSPSATRSTASSPASRSCRATTGGARWPARPCAPTSTARWSA